MNKKMIAMIAAFVFTIGAFAQEGRGQGRGFGGQRKTMEERIAEVHAKFDSTFHFAADKQAKVDSAFAESFKAQDKFREEMRASFTPGQQPDPSIREKMQEKIKEIQVARDEKLQEILSEEEYKKFKDELEPAMRPQRGGGQGGNGGGRGGN